ncbi:hypothetical protein [Oceanispirochaeta sp.]|uniref:hypothetical protein n=1 Tax=Oceanispirochaeta sp. TaxID=2035350 RepID=UPI0026289AE9|nr:hypothetical protein [Oceanispirochaeta sp.]MDA3957563.1 hypothetical protein [Oceanispirochaeta sp.]
MNLIGNFFKKFIRRRQSDDFPRIINTYKKFAALGIGKTADPLQVFIPSGLFEFYILGFLHCRLHSLG